MGSDPDPVPETDRAGSADPVTAGMLADEGVGPPLLPDGGHRAVSREDQGAVGEVEQLGLDAREQLRPVAPEVGPADRAGEQDVAAEDERGVELVADEDDRAGAVARDLAD